MSIIKEKILFDGQTKYINFSLRGDKTPLGFQHDVNELTEYKTLDIVNEVVDGEKRKYRHYNNSTVDVIFYFLNSENVFYNGFNAAGFTNNDIKLNSSAMQNSFFIFDFFDTYNISNQTKLFSTYITKIRQENVYPTYILDINPNTVNKNQLYYQYVPRSYILSQNTSTVTGYTKVSFYSAKDGILKTFVHDNDIESLEQKLFVKTELNFINRTWKFIIPSNELRLFELKNGNEYNIRINNTFNKESISAPNYPEKKIFNYSNGRLLKKFK